jgi:gp16 family phage-associated protein
MATQAEKIKGRFGREGISIREWARARGYSWRTVYAVLNGELKGNRGLSHQIAVELGLKAEPKILRYRAARGSDAA